MQPETTLRRLFPDYEAGITPNRYQLELFAEYWDDGESELTNVEAIRRWLDRVDSEVLDAHGG